MKSKVKERKQAGKQRNGRKRLAQFEGKTLGLLGKIVLISKSLFFLFQRKIGRNLIDSHYFCLKKRTIHLSSCLFTLEKDI